MLEVNNLECIRGDRSLFSGLDFAVNRGELLHLKGHNGSGKTTLMRALCGLITPTQGEVLWNGTNIRRQREEYAADILYLGHLSGIKDDLTAVENLQILGKLDGLSIPEAQIWQALQEIGLRGHEDLPVRVLSQGQKRRVALARLLFSQSPFWLLDEPFTGIDPISRTELQELILALKKKGIGILISDHNVRETLEITDRAYLIYDAKVLLSGDAQTLINDTNARKLYLGEKFKI